MGVHRIPALIVENGPEKDPWAEEAIGNLSREHREAWKGWDRLSPQDQLQRIRAQIQEYAQFHAVQKHVWYSINFIHQALMGRNLPDHVLEASDFWEIPDEPADGETSEEMKRWAERCLMPFEFNGTNCRILFLANSLWMKDVEDGTFMSFPNPMTAITPRLVAQGVDPQTVGAMVLVPFFDAGKWGEGRTKYTPSVLRKIFFPYAKKIVQILRPATVVVCQTDACRVVQEQFDPAARNATPIDPNMFVDVRFGRGSTLNLIRILHVASVKDDKALISEREAGIDALLRRFAPNRPVRNMEDVLAGRVNPQEDGDQYGQCMNNRVMCTGFPDANGISFICRWAGQGGLIVNFTNRATSHHVRRSNQVDEVMLRPDMLEDPLQVFTFLHSTLVPRRIQKKKVVLICNTGYRYSVLMAIMFRAHLDLSMSLGHLVQWGSAIRNRVVELSDQSHISNYKRFLQRKGWSGDTLWSDAPDPTYALTHSLVWHRDDDKDVRLFRHQFDEGRLALRLMQNEHPELDFGLINKDDEAEDILFPGSEGLRALFRTVESNQRRRTEE